MLGLCRGLTLVFRLGFAGPSRGLDPLYALETGLGLVGSDE